MEPLSSSRVSPDTTGVLLSFPAVSDGNLLRCGFREDAAIQATALDVALPVRCVVDNTSTDWPELATVAYHAYPPGGATLTSELPANHFVEQRKPFALPSTPLTFSDPSVTHTGWGNNLGLGENTTININVGSFHASFIQGASLEYDSNLPAGTALVSGTVPGVYVAAGGTSIKLSTNQLVCNNPVMCIPDGASMEFIMDWAQTM